MVGITEIRKTIRYRQVWLFASLVLLLIIVAVALPNDYGRFSLAERLLVFAVGISALSCAASLSYYFVDSWKNLERRKQWPYRAWLGVETLAGIPLAVVCAAFGALCLWRVLLGK